jgi:hypothetical protein
MGDGTLMIKYKVGDLFQAKTGFMGEWIDNKTFLLVKLENGSDPYVLHCQENGRTLQTTKITLDKDMVKLNDI